MVFIRSELRSSFQELARLLGGSPTVAAAKRDLADLHDHLAVTMRRTPEEWPKSEDEERAELQKQAAERV